MLVRQFEFSEKKPFWVMKSASKLKTEEKKKQKSLLTSYFIWLLPLSFIGLLFKLWYCYLYDNNGK